MATPAPRLRSLYRSLLRELPPRPVLSTPRAPLHGRLRDSFGPATASNTSTSSSSPSTTTTAAAEAEASSTTTAEAARTHQLVTYLRAQRTYVNLLERYNPGIHLEDDERIRLTARRVGMDMPAEYGKGNKGEDK